MIDIPASHAGAVRMYGPEFAGDLAEFYRRTRAEHGPVTPVLLVGDVPAWLVMPYQDVLHVCRNPQVFSRSSYHWNLWPQIPDDWPLILLTIPVPGLLQVEGEEHRRRAGALSDVIEEVDGVVLGRMCERAADELIDSFSAEGEADLVAQYSQQLVPTLLARLMGFPEEQIPELNADLLEASVSSPEAAAAGARVIAVIGAFVAAQRREPGPGLMGGLIRHPAGLSDEELTFDVSVFFGAGQQPTANWISSALRLMLLEDDSPGSPWEGGRPSVDEALTEVLWHDPPVHNLTGRWALRDIELGGHRIGKGDFILVSIATANAEARNHPEPGAGANRAHVAFGHGEHSCPSGIPDLAEVIARTAAGVLLDRLPDAHLTVPAGDLRWNESTWLRSLASLPVSFTPVTPRSP